MKIDLKLPGRGELHIEWPPRQPMSHERFGMLYILALVLIGTVGFIKFFEMFL